MKNYAKIDHVNRKIIMDRTFAKYAEIVGSPEYNQLQACRKDYPTYTVERKQIKHNAKKECYRGLTYEYMEDYIEAHADAADRHKQFDELRILAKCHSIRYPTIKAWFLSTYPEVVEFGMNSTEVFEITLKEAV